MRQLHNLFSNIVVLSNEKIPFNIFSYRSVMCFYGLVYLYAFPVTLVHVGEIIAKVLNINEKNQHILSMVFSTSSLS